MRTGLRVHVEQNRFRYPRQLRSTMGNRHRRHAFLRRRKDDMGGLSETNEPSELTIL